MKKYFLIIVFAGLLHSIAFPQVKYAIILSAASIADDAEKKQIAENNVHTILEGLSAQGFIPGHIVLPDKVHSANELKESFNLILNQVKKEDVIFFYTDLPIKTVSGKSRTSGKEYQLILSKDNTGILLSDFAEFIKNAAVRSGTADMVFSVFDSEVIAPETGSVMTSELNCAFSCQPGEKKVIADGISIYTKALANAFLKRSFAISTYESLFYGIHREVLLQTTLQHPVLSSNKSLVFKGMFNKTRPFISVSEQRSDSVFVINAGEAMMLTKGSVVEFYRQNSVYLPEFVLAKGIITEVNVLSALVKTDRPLRRNVNELAAFISDSRPVFKLNFNTELIKTNKTAIALFEKLKKDYGAQYLDEVSSGGDLAFAYVRLTGDTFSVQLQNPVSGLVYEDFSFLNNGEGLAELANLIRTHAVYKSINNLSNTIPQLDIDWGFSYPSGKQVEIRNGFPVTYDGDELQLKIKNNSGLRLFYGMIDMQPDKRINVVFPNENMLPQDAFINPGDSTIVDLTMSPPFGIEKVKLFTSLKPVVIMDWFRSLSEGRSLNRGGNESNAGQLQEININSFDFEIRNRIFKKDEYGNISQQFKTTGRKDTLVVANHSLGSIYYNVVNQEPDGGFEVILPDNKNASSDCMIKPGGTYTRELNGKFNSDNLLTLYSDRPFNINDFVTTDRTLNDRILEIMRFKTLSGTPVSNVNLIYGFEKNPGAERMRGGTDLNIRIVTPKVSSDRGGSVETQSPKLQVAGLVYSMGNAVVKQLKINGAPVSYDDKLRLFEYEIELQSGVNRVVIEAMDDKGYVATSTFEVELKSNGTNVVSATGKNYFLGVGINKYEHYDELKNPVRDVSAFADILQNKFGYEKANIKLLLDSMATRKNIISEIRQFLKKTGPNDNVIIYLAGHGNSDPLSDGQYYFLPKEAERSDPAESGLKSTDILDPFRHINAKHCLLIVDACYSGMMTNTEEKLSPLLKGSNEAAPEDIPSKYVLASGQAVPVPDGSGEHSFFALTLMNYLKENNDPLKLRINKIEEYLEMIVPQISPQQHPTGKKIDGRGIMVFKVK